MSLEVNSVSQTPCKANPSKKLAQYHELLEQYAVETNKFLEQLRQRLAVVLNPGSPEECGFHEQECSDVPLFRAMDGHCDAAIAVNHQLSDILERLAL